MTTTSNDTYTEAKPRIPHQLIAVRNLMEDGQWRTLSQISIRTGYPEASVSARLRDLRKAPHNRTVERRLKEPGLYQYRMVPLGLIFEGRNTLIQNVRGI